MGTSPIPEKCAHGGAAYADGNRVPVKNFREFEVTCRAGKSIISLLTVFQVFCFGVCFIKPGSLGPKRES